MHKSIHSALAILLGLNTSGGDSDEKSPIQSSDAAARDTGTIGATASLVWPARPAYEEEDSD